MFETDRERSNSFKEKANRLSSEVLELKDENQSVRVRMRGSEASRTDDSGGGLLLDLSATNSRLLPDPTATWKRAISELKLLYMVDNGFQLVQNLLPKYEVEVSGVFEWILQLSKTSVGRRLLIGDGVRRPLPLKMTRAVKQVMVLPEVFDLLALFYLLLPSCVLHCSRVFLCSADLKNFFPSFCLIKASIKHFCFVVERLSTLLFSYLCSLCCFCFF